MSCAHDAGVCASYTMAVHVPVKCKHVRGLPVWQPNWGEIYSEREGGRQRVSGKKRERLKIMVTVREKEKKRDMLNGVRCSTIEGSRKIWGENGALNNSRRPDAVRGMTGTPLDAQLWRSALIFTDKSERRGASDTLTAEMKFSLKQWSAPDSCWSGRPEMLQEHAGHGKLKQHYLESIQHFKIQILGPGQTWAHTNFLKDTLYMSGVGLLIWSIHPLSTEVSDHGNSSCYFLIKVKENQVLLLLL